MKAAKHNVLVITYWSFKDALIQTYTLPYVKMIASEINPKSKVYLYTSEQRGMKMTKEQWMESKSFFKETYNIHLLRSAYTNFGIFAMFKQLLVLLRLLFLSIFNKVKTIHVFCTPAGVFGYWISLLTKKKLIIDSYEPHAESMVENGTWRKNSFSFKLLFWHEKKMSARASTVIAVSPYMSEYAERKYNVQIKNMFVKPAGVDVALFYPDLDLRNKKRQELGLEKNDIVGMYMGKFGGIYLNEEIIVLVKAAQLFWGDRFKMFICTSSAIGSIENMLIKYEVNSEFVFLSEYLPHEDVAAMLNAADFAINPVRPVPSKKYCTSIKDGEYWAVGLPVIITPNISVDSDIIQNENIGVIWDDFSSKGALNAINKMEELLKQETGEIREIIRQIAIERRSFNVHSTIYREIFK